MYKNAKNQEQLMLFSGNLCNIRMSCVTKRLYFGTAHTIELSEPAPNSQAHIASDREQIKQKRQFRNELPLCSPREYSKACVSISYKVYQPIYQRKEKNVKKAYFFRFLGYFEVY